MSDEPGFGTTEESCTVASSEPKAEEIPTGFPPLCGVGGVSLVSLSSWVRRARSGEALPEPRRRGGSRRLERGGASRRGRGGRRGRSANERDLQH